jgi:hypothetical protein
MVNFSQHPNREREQMTNAISRQVRRAAERAAHKAATRPGPRKAVPPKPKVPGGPGAFERHVFTLSKFGDAVERTYHFTKGYRRRRVSLDQAVQS